VGAPTGDVPTLEMWARAWRPGLLARVEARSGPVAAPTHRKTDE